MLYQKSEIAKRLKKERKALDLTQQELADRINYSKPVIVSWESAGGNNRIPTMEQLIALCDLYDCEVGYLLCEYDQKTRAATDIHNETGLSEAAIDVLHRKKDEANILFQILGPAGRMSAYYDLLGISSTEEFEQRYKYSSEQSIIPDFTSHLITSDGLADICTAIMSLAYSISAGEGPEPIDEYENIGKQNFGTSYTEIIKAQAAATNREFQEHVISKRLESIVHDYIDVLSNNLRDMKNQE